MKALKLVGSTILLIILLSFLKLLLAKVHSDSAPLITNITMCLQLFLLGGIVFYFLMAAVLRLFKRKEIPVWKTMLMYVAILMAFEIATTYILKNAGIVSDNTKRYLTEYYINYERSIPERRKDCGCYDSTLIYTYKPHAKCVQQELEFSDSIVVNSAGLRDDEVSLQHPDIICVGDSYTMGWGVEQQQAFPQLLEQATGLKVLNAGISSYGTARETLMLNRLDTSNLKIIIIQFHYNDLAENTAYIKNGYKLPVPPSYTYDSLVTYHKWSSVYFPFKRSLMITRIAANDLWRRMRNPDYLQSEWKSFYDTSYVAGGARSFVDILYHSDIDFKKLKVLVIDVNRYPMYDHHFLEVAGNIAKDSLYSRKFGNNLHFVQTPELNDRQCFYELDTHLTAYGHEVLAKKIRATIGTVMQ